jgi:hypothetical protein
MSTTPEPEQVPAQPTFDKQLEALFNATIAQAFQTHADVLRGVCVIFDYHGELNFTDTAQAIVSNSTQTRPAPPEIVGMIDACMSVTSYLQSLAAEDVTTLESKLARIMAEVLRRKEQLDELDKAIRDKSTVADGNDF